MKSGGCEVVINTETTCQVFPKNRIGDALQFLQVAFFAGDITALALLGIGWANIRTNVSNGSKFWLVYWSRLCEYWKHLHRIRVSLIYNLESIATCTQH